MCQMLIGAGARLDLTSAAGETPLHLAAWCEIAPRSRRDRAEMNAEMNAGPCAGPCAEIAPRLRPSLRRDCAEIAPTV